MNPPATPDAGTVPQREALRREAETAMSRARSALLLREPFFGWLAMRLRLQADESCAQLWTDGKTIGFHPAFAATLPPDKLLGALAHEVLHLACGHHVRRGGRDVALWNEACDVVVNALLLEAGFRLPEGFVQRPALAGQSADAVYAVLRQERGTPGTGLAGQDRAGSADASRPEQRERTAESGSARPREGQSPQKQRTQDGPRSGKGRPARERRRSEREPVPVFSGEVRDAPALRDSPEADAEADLRRQVERDVREALRRARHAGRIPAGFARLWHREGAGQTDWAALLRRFVAQCAENDFSWCMPNRRFLHTGCYLPGRRDVRIPCLVVALDCSGSVDAETLSAFMRELEQALLPYDAEAVVLCHDCRIQSVVRGQGRDVLRRIQLRGGGGTDYRPVGRWLEEQGVRPACLLWFTDMECDLFPPEPPCPTLWLVWGDNDRQPPFGQRASLTPPAPSLEKIA